MSDSISSSPSRPGNPGYKSADVGVCVLLVLLVFLVFGRTCGFGFVNYDDDICVYNNPHVIKGLSLKGLTWAFTHRVNYNWQPLTVLSNMADCQIYGLNAGGHHLTNVLLHAVTVLLLFQVLRKMTGALWCSAFVAAVFAIHPLRVESVAWISERKDVLSGLFFMLTLWAYMRYARHSFSWSRYLLVVVLFMLGLLSKPMVVTLPFLLLLLDYWPLNRFAPPADTNSVAGTVSARNRFGHLLLEKIPLLALSGAVCVITLLVQREIITQPPIFSRIGNAVVSYGVYLGQMVWPARLAVFYPYPVQGLPVWEVTLACLLLIVVSAGTFWWRQKHPYFLVGWLWYLGMLVPVIGLVPSGLRAHADRYTYLPQIGLYLMVAWAARDLSVSWRHRRRVLGVAAAGIIGALAVCAWKQTSYWRNGESLWKHALACTSGNYTAQNNLGYLLAAQGRTAEAVEHYRKSLEIYPYYPQANNNLGVILLKEGWLDEAAKYFRRAVKSQPDFADAYNNLGNLSAAQGKPSQAIEYYQKAIDINPDLAKAYNNLAIQFASQGRFTEASQCYRKSLELDPAYVDAHNNFGILLARQGRFTEAMKQFRIGLKLQGNSAEAYNDLGHLLVLVDHPDEAVKYYQKALELRPDYAEAYYNLGVALFRLGKVQEAIGRWKQALRFKPDDAEVHDSLGVALANQGRYTEAKDQFQKTLELANDQGNSRLANTAREQLRLCETKLSPLPKP